MYEYIDDSRLKEKIIDITLPLEKIYKEDKGESIPAQLRHGRLDDGLYSNRMVINTRYNETLINPQIKVYFRAFTDNDSMITVDIFNSTDKCLFKKFVIKSINNDYTIDDMKTICDEIKDILNDSIEGKTVALIEYIRTKENLIFEEIVQ